MFCFSEIVSFQRETRRICPSYPLYQSCSALFDVHRCSNPYRWCVSAMLPHCLRSRDRYSPVIMIHVFTCDVRPEAASQILTCVSSSALHIFKGALNLREFYKLWNYVWQVRAFCPFAAVSLSMHRKTQQQQLSASSCFFGNL